MAFYKIQIDLEFTYQASELLLVKVPLFWQALVARDHSKRDQQDIIT